MKKIDLPISIEDRSPSHPDLKWMGSMLGILGAFLITGYLLFYIFAYFIIANISLETEKKYLGDMFHGETETAQFDSEKLQLDFNIPEIYNVFITQDEQVNAFATLGGTLLLTTGLFTELEYEEELVFIIGHEIKHLENRDPLQKVLTDIPFLLTLGFLGFDIDLGIDSLSKIASNYVGKTKEISADLGGIELLEKSGANVGCALAFFQRNDSFGGNALELLSDHPTTLSRIKQIKDHIQQDDFDFGVCTPLNYQQ